MADHAKWFYTVEPKEDFNRWAGETQERFKKNSVRDCVDPAREDYEFSGPNPVDVCLPPDWENGVEVAAGYHCQQRSKLLLVSSIGPSEDLRKLSIPLIHNLPGASDNLKDHFAVFIAARVSSKLTDRYVFESNVDRVEKARK
ncbi:hypothetical protein BDD12DRAFT_808505 [Trichophaea hybrida]|nr:hypothetical protein BDD12DRAFT_808505 [Trichophaea hybrida]